MPDISSRPLIALTGATGFIGQHLQRALLDAGCSVRALVRSRSLASPALAEGTQVVEADLGSETSMEEALDGVNQLIYAAGSVRGRVPEDFELANVTGVKVAAAVLASRQPGVRMLLISSLAASAPELSHYAASKRAGENALRDSALTGWTILRPPAVYGPREQDILNFLGGNTGTQLNTSVAGKGLAAPLHQEVVFKPLGDQESEPCPLPFYQCVDDRGRTVPDHPEARVKLLEAEIHSLDRVFDGIEIPDGHILRGGGRLPDDEIARRRADPYLWRLLTTCN